MVAKFHGGVQLHGISKASPRNSPKLLARTQEADHAPLLLSGARTRLQVCFATATGHSWLNAMIELDALVFRIMGGSSHITEAPNPSKTEMFSVRSLPERCTASQLV